MAPGERDRLLRLLSNPAVMDEDVVQRAAAWRVIDQLRADERVVWAQAADATLATPDRKLRNRYPSVQVETLT